eukprot:6180343-Pleurochrysis_carterae.AAC.1
MVAELWWRAAPHDALRRGQNGAAAATFPTSLSSYDDWLQLTQGRVLNVDRSGGACFVHTCTQLAIDKPANLAGGPCLA